MGFFVQSNGGILKYSFCAISLPQYVGILLQRVTTLSIYSAFSIWLKMQTIKKILKQSLCDYLYHPL